MANTRTIVRRVAKAVVGISAGAVTNRLLSSTRDDEDSPFDKATNIIGSSVVGAMVGDLAGDWIDKQFEELFETVDEAKEELSNES